jgi:hypothetical protein
VTAGTPVEGLAAVEELVGPQAAAGDAVAESAGAGIVASAAPDGLAAEVGQVCSPVALGGFEAGQVCFRVVPAEFVVGQDELRVVQVLLQAGRAGLVVSGGGCWVVLAVSPVDLGG